MSRRTKEEFDDWFRGGDPWNYHSSFVTERLTGSLYFMKRFFKADFKGTIIEFGAYKGDFTYLLAQQFPDATIIANDISSVAVDKMKEKLAAYPRIQFLCSDMLTLDLGRFRTEERIVVLLLENLYYLGREEQQQLLDKLSDTIPQAQLFVSAPISGEKYYHETQLMQLFMKSGYLCKEISVLNLNRIIPPMRFYLWITNKWAWLRRRLAHQVLYLFVHSKQQ